MDVEQFYRDNYDLYVKRLSRQAGSVSNAEDVVQEAFYRVLKYKDTFDPNGAAPFEAWFNSVLRRALYDFKRIELKQGMTAALDSGEPEFTDMDGVGNKMAEEILRRIKTYDNPTHRNVLYLGLVKQYPPRDIVEILDLGLFNVKQILRRFRREMEEIYE